jgi:hypothetical protein
MSFAARQLSLFKGKRQRGVKPPPALEFETHCALADTLRRAVTPGWLWTHFPAGEERPAHIDKRGRRVSSEGARLKRMGLKPGWADFLFVSPAGRLHCLELKRGNAPLNDAQQDFRDAITLCGVPYAVARSYDEAIQILTSWGAVRVRVSV